MEGAAQQQLFLQLASLTEMYPTKLWSLYLASGLMFGGWFVTYVQSLSFIVFLAKVKIIFNLEKMEHSYWETDSEIYTVLEIKLWLMLVKKNPKTNNLY